MTTKLLARVRRYRLIETQRHTVPITQVSPIVNIIQKKLRKLMEGHILAGGSPSINIPSILELAGIFGCPETDVFNALNLLQQEGFRYQIFGLDTPIQLQDSLYSKKQKVSS